MQSICQFTELRERQELGFLTCEYTFTPLRKIQGLYLIQSKVSPFFFFFLISLKKSFHLSKVPKVVHKNIGIIYFASN